MTEALAPATERRDPGAAARWLRSAAAVRERAHAMLALAECGTLADFEVDLDRIDQVADYVVATLRAHYPDLNIPFHSRWRHFGVGGVDRWSMLAASLDGVAPAERARIRMDLAVISVLLDAGAGASWRYREQDTDTLYTRSEGLAVASFHLFRQGLCSSDPTEPLRVDAEALLALPTAAVAAALQATPGNALPGIEGRTQLLRRLGRALYEHPELFGTGPPRLGNLFDALAARARHGELRAHEILEALLSGLSGIWGGRPRLAGLDLGDVWQHPQLRTDDATDGYVPLHKLSQWLAYSLVEPMEEAGIRITGLDELTGLAEYRNGGLFVDLGVLRPRRLDAYTTAHAVDSSTVVAWRALTVALLDLLVVPVRSRLGLDAHSLPLVRMLEGGTWHAGRRVAREKRGAAAPPPLHVISDGTVF